NPRLCDAWARKLEPRLCIQCLVGAASFGSPPPACPLPQQAPTSQLIGREQDSVAVRDLLLQTPGRLVTLTGTGGCGKTQLALLVACEVADAFPCGAWVVGLAR